MVWRVVHSLTTNPEVRVISSGGEAERDSGGERNADGELWEGGHLWRRRGGRGEAHARGEGGLSQCKVKYIARESHLKNRTHLCFENS